MEYLIKVHMALYKENVGFVVIGHNKDWRTIHDCSKILDVKGKNVVIRTSEGDCLFEVVNLDISFSFTGIPCFGLVLKENDNFEKIASGDKVFKV